MKNRNTILITLFSFLILCMIYACSSENNGEDQSEGNNDENNNETVLEDISVESIFNNLKTVRFPLSWEIESSDKEGNIGVTPDEMKQLNLLENPGIDNFIFFWKYPGENRNLICFGLQHESGMTGYYTEHYLVTLDKEFRKIDQMVISGEWPEDVDQYGESLGTVSQTAVIESPEKIRITDDQDEITYLINSDGFFVKDIGNITPEALKEFKKLFESSSTFPLVLDSAFFANHEDRNLNALTAQQAMTLYTNGKEIANMYSNVETFIKIDSMKQADVYEAFLNSNPWPEIIHSNACAVLKLNFNNDTSAYIWKISDATGESGPWSDGSNMFISFAVNDKIISAYPIAEMSSSGDSPAYADKRVYASIYQNGKIVIDFKEVYGDDDSENEEVTKKQFVFQLRGGILEEISDGN